MVQGGKEKTNVPSFYLDLKIGKKTLSNLVCMGYLIVIRQP